VDARDRRELALLDVRPVHELLDDLAGMGTMSSPDFNREGVLVPGVRRRR
jgi:hypothetical protein